MKTSEKQSVFLPEGYIEVKTIPQTKIADIYASMELITDNELDSFYFRALEEKNIYLNEKQIEAVRTIDKSVLAIAAGTFHSVFLRILRSRGYNKLILSKL